MYINEVRNSRKLKLSVRFYFKGLWKSFDLQNEVTLKRGEGFDLQRRLISEERESRIFISIRRAIEISGLSRSPAVLSEIFEYPFTRRSTIPIRNSVDIDITTGRACDQDACLENSRSAFAFG